MTSPPPTKRHLSPRAILMGALGFVTVPILIVVWALSGAALGIRPVPGSSIYDFSMPIVEGDQDWFDNGYVEFITVGQDRKTRPFVGERAVLSGVEWRYGGAHRPTHEVLDELRKRGEARDNGRIAHVAMTCLNAAEYDGVQAEIWIQAAREGEAQFNALSPDDLRLAQRVQPGPALPTLKDYRACGVMAGYINDVLDEAIQE